MKAGSYADAEERGAVYTGDDVMMIHTKVL